MAESLTESTNSVSVVEALQNDCEEFDDEFAEQRKENEDAVKLETEVGAYKNNNEDLKLENGELQHGLPDLDKNREDIIKEVNKKGSQLDEEDDEFAEQRKENEDVVKLETEVGAYKNNNEDLKLENGGLQYGLPDLKNNREDIIKEVNKIRSQLDKEEEYKNYMEELDIRMTALELMHEMCHKETEENETKSVKISTYTIIRKEKYPYIILRTKSYDQALKELRIEYPNMKEVYKVNYDDEETYSSNRMIREFGNIEIHNDELLFKNYTEQKFLKDLETFSSTHQNGCRTFALLRKDDHLFPYYGLYVNQVNYDKSKMKLQRRYPNLVELYQLVGVPDGAKLHLHIKEASVENVGIYGNHIKLFGNYAEDEFIKQVKTIAEIEQYFAPMLYPNLPVRELVESRFNT